MTKPSTPRAWNSTLRVGKGLARSAGIGSARKPLAKVGKQKAKRQARNAEYYRSAEWRAKRKAVFERDGYRCTERIPYDSRFHLPFGLDEDHAIRCPNRGEIVNGKQTGKGLVCEEKSYGHRGHEDRIDTCTTRCKDCDRRCTPNERINHSHGFNNSNRTTA